MSSRTGGVVLADMTNNPSYMAVREPVTTFTTGTLAEGGKEKEDCSLVVLPFEANQEDMIAAADEMYMYVHK